MIAALEDGVETDSQIGEKDKVEYEYAVHPWISEHFIIVRFRIDLDYLRPCRLLLLLVLPLDQLVLKPIYCRLVYRLLEELQDYVCTAQSLLYLPLAHEGQLASYCQFLPLEVNVHRDRTQNHHPDQHLVDSQQGCHQDIQLLALLFVGR
jgi:hypothetical protein